MNNLALQYRPRTFEEVVGQEAIISILQYQTAKNLIKNSYLFCGPSGCGKTTVARILANVLNDGVGTPIEIDAASNTGVDNVRNIINEASFKNISAPYKVFIIDECHMLSIGAWNALLKLLEEPPAHCVIILCTTDPQKVPTTILTRVQRFDFSRIPNDLIVDRLIDIIKEEQKIHGKDSCIYTTEGLEYIAEISDGGLRTAISILDKCLDYSNEVTTTLISEALGVVHQSILKDLIYALLDGSTEEALNIIEKIFMSGKDMKMVIKNMIQMALKLKKEQLRNNTYEPYLVPLLTRLIEISNSIKYESNPFYLIQAEFIVFTETIVDYGTDQQE